MPKTITLPSLYDEALQMSISKLKDLGYLTPAAITKGILNWSSNGVKIGSISIQVNTLCKTPYIELDYKYKSEERKYQVRLVSVPSNLGKGHNWYFLCPQTNKRCRKLYSIGGYFFHRDAFDGCMYESQTYSKSYRQLNQSLGAYFRTDELYNKLSQKHFKKKYAGKPTKRYVRIMKQIKKAEGIHF